MSVLLWTKVRTKGRVTKDEYSSLKRHTLAIVIALNGEVCLPQL